MKAQCEIMITDVLPAVRCIMAEELREKGLTQGEIAGLLGITQPAVSQYLKKSRGRNVEEFRKDGKAMEIIHGEVEHLFMHRDNRGFCPLCQKIIDTDFVRRTFSSPAYPCRKA